MGAASASMAFEVASTGAVASEVRGQLSLGPAGAVELSAEGTFAGEPVNLRLSSGAGTMEFGNPPRLSTAPTPEHLREALVVGLTRMGLLHNVAVLSSGGPPDHADGGVGEWAVADEFEWDPTDPSAVRFALTVGGVPAATGSLAFDSVGLPTERRQTVQFPDGVMEVVERYSWLTVERGGEPAPEAQVRAALESYYAAFSDRDWPAFAGHFWPGAVITTIWTPAGESSDRVVATTVPDFVAQADEGPGSAEIFEEVMLQADLRVENGLAQAWVTYRARFGDPGEVMEWEGVDSFSLLRHDGQWRITSLTFMPDAG